MVEVIIGRVGSEIVIDVAVSFILPVGPTDGVYCEEFSVGVLHLLSTAAQSEAEILFYVYNKTSNRWTEDPSERRTIGVGLDYLRRFDVRAIDRVTLKLVSKTGTYDLLWTFA